MTPLTEIIGFGEKARDRGLFYVDTPGNDLISLTGLAAAGCNVITCSTEYAVPYGFPPVAVIKINAKDTPRFVWKADAVYCKPLRFQVPEHLLKITHYALICRLK